MGTFLQDWLMNIAIWVVTGIVGLANICLGFYFFVLAFVFEDPFMRGGPFASASLVTAFFLCGCFGIVLAAWIAYEESERMMED